MNQTMPRDKEFIPNVTKEDLKQWREQMYNVRRLMMKGKWKEGQQAIDLMDEIFDSMMDQFATGEGIWV